MKPKKNINNKDIRPKAINTTANENVYPNNVMGIVIIATHKSISCFTVSMRLPPYTFPYSDDTNNTERSAYKRDYPRGEKIKHYAKHIDKCLCLLVHAL